MELKSDDPRLTKNLGEGTNPVILSRLLREMSGTRGKNILDIGCGTGELSSNFVFNNRVYGIDNIYRNVRQAQAKGIRAVKGNIERKIPFRDDFFDIIICTEVLEHLQKPDRVMKEMRRMLAPHGIIYITVPNFYSITNRFLILLGRHRGVEYPHLLAIRHIRNYSQAGMKELLNSCGLQTEMIRGIGFHPMKDSPVLDFLEKYLGTICDNMILKVVKK